jgi:hypothetical protein
MVRIRPEEPNLSDITAFFASLTYLPTILPHDAHGQRAESTDIVKEQALQRSVYRCERCGTRGSLEFHYRGHRADRSMLKVLAGDAATSLL